MQKTNDAMARTLFFDESGYTGQDMLHTDQRVFAIAAHDLPEERCKAIISDIFGGTNVGELKYSALRRRPNHQKRIISLLEAVREERATTKTYVVDKHFSLCQRIFDYFTENVLHANGVNIFQGAANIVISNNIYLDLLDGLGSQSVGLILAKFESMMRNRSEEAYHDFWITLEAARRFAPDQTHQALDALLFGKHLPVDVYLGIPSDALDLSFTVMFAIMCDWQQSSTDHFNIVHDESKNAETYRGCWEQLTSPDLSTVIAGVGDYRSVELPLRVDHLEFARSNDYAGLQVADCMAGAIAEVTRQHIGAPCKEEFASQLIEAGFGEFTNSIVADRNWSPPPEALHADAQDPYKSLTDIIGASYPH